MKPTKAVAGSRFQAYHSQGALIPQSSTRSPRRDDSCLQALGQFAPAGGLARTSALWPAASVSCVDGSRIARGLLMLATGSDAVLCPACLRGRGPLALMVCAGEVPFFYAGFKEALDIRRGVLVLV